MPILEGPPPSPGKSALRYRSVFLFALVGVISLLFVMVIRRFLLALFLAAVFAGLVQPLYRWVLPQMGSRRGLASITTILMLLLVVGLPLAGFLTLVTTQGIEIGQQAGAWFANQSGRLDELHHWLSRLPFMDRYIPDVATLGAKFQGLAERTGPVLLGTVAVATRGTLSFLLQLFVMLYALFYFLIDGPILLRRILDFMPLSQSEEDALLGRFISVTRATLKGSLLIGMAQGALAGLAFWVSGIPGAAFWGTVMTVFAIIPAVGAGLVWVPAVVYLFLGGQTIPAIGLLIWCLVVVSTVDNFLRPLLVGRDARMSDLMVLISTLGGIVLFGAPGFIVGPIIAALFVTAWHIYGDAFQSWLPASTVPTLQGDTAP